MGNLSSAFRRMEKGPGVFLALAVSQGPWIQNNQCQSGKFWGCKLWTCTASASLLNDPWPAFMGNRAQWSYRVASGRSWFLSPVLHISQDLKVKLMSSTYPVTAPKFSFLLLPGFAIEVSGSTNVFQPQRVRGNDQSRTFEIRLWRFVGIRECPWG